MKKHFYTILEIALIARLLAVPANPNPIIFTQPDNVKFTGFVNGDEWQHWYETPDGFTFDKNKHGEWVYVKSVVKGKFELTDIKIVDGSLPGIVISFPKHLKPERNAPTPLDNIPDLQSVSRTNFNIPMLLIEFPDLLANNDVENFSDMMNLENYESSQGVTGSFNDYFQEVSYGNFDPTTDVTGWFMVMVHPMDITKFAK